MNLKDLSIQTMISLSAAWIDPARERSSLEASPITAVYLPAIDAMHAALVATQPRDVSSAELTALIAEETAEDTIHDRMLRGAHWVLSGLAEITDSEEERKAYLAARDTLAPEGLRETQRAYTAESGEIHRLEARLTPEVKALLGNVKAPGGTLWDATKRRMKAGKKLGLLEAKRVKLEAEVNAVKRDSTSRADVLRARNAWIRVVRALEAALDLDGVSEEAKAAVLAPLNDAGTRAQRRTGSKKEESEALPNAEPVKAAPLPAQPA